MNNHSDNAVVDKNLRELITGIDKGTEDSFYPIEKLDAHVRNVPHVAISIFVFCNQHILLQKRAETKYHSGGLWANTVCSHPRWEESAQSCAGRRLREELGWNVPLRKFGLINYAARVGELYENEHVHCFYGRLDKSELPSRFNPQEVSAVQWLTIPEIMEQIDIRPESFTPWFKIYMAKHRTMIDSVLYQCPT
ncbi:MAG: isopentenyl-diphosphate Delta-isomerase [Granulosicoccus sp.]